MGKAFLEGALREGFAFNSSKSANGACGAKLEGKKVFAVITTGCESGFFKNLAPENDQTAFIRSACAYMAMKFEGQLFYHPDSDLNKVISEYKKVLSQ